MGIAYTEEAIEVIRIEEQHMAQNLDYPRHPNTIWEQNNEARILHSLHQLVIVFPLLTFSQ